MSTKNQSYDIIMVNELYESHVAAKLRRAERRRRKLSSKRQEPLLVGFPLDLVGDEGKPAHRDAA